MTSVALDAAVQTRPPAAGEVEEPILGLADAFTDPIRHLHLPDMHSYELPGGTS